MYNILRVLGLAAVALCLASPCDGQQNTRRDQVTQPTPATPPENAAGIMKITLKQGFDLKGSAVDIETIKVNTLFGEANIPIHTIAGIRFAQEPSEQTTVVLLNGDALTGELAMTDLKFVSDWGEAKVNVAHVVSIVFRPDFNWSPVNTPNGRRWRLTKNEMGSNQYPGNIVYPSNRTR